MDTNSEEQFLVIGATIEANKQESDKNQKMKQRWAYQQYDTEYKTTILLTLINQENLKRKQQWCHWVGEVYSFNWLR